MACFDLTGSRGDIEEHVAWTVSAYIGYTEAQELQTTQNVRSVALTVSEQQSVCPTFSTWNASRFKPSEGAYYVYEIQIHYS